MGIGTTSPGFKLQINEPSGESMVLVRNDATIYSGDVLGGIGFDGTDGGVTPYVKYSSAAIVGIANGSHSSSNKGGDLAFFTTRNGDGASTPAYEAMRISSEGNVGIATTRPLSKLSVGATGSSSYTGYFSNTSTSAGGAIYGVKEVPGGSDSGYGVYGRCLTGGSGYQIGVYGYASDSSPTTGGRRRGVYGVAGNGDVNSGVYGKLSGSNDGAGIFGADASGNDAILDGKGQWAGFFDGDVNIEGDLTVSGDIAGMYWVQSGSNLYPENTSWNVGIGTTTPTYKLHVNGRIKSDGINETSDARLKKNVQTIGDALNKVMAMRGVQYEWKDKQMESGVHIGLIAQEVEKILPEVVDTDDEGYKSVQYSVMVALLIEAIKDQQEKIESQQKEYQEILQRMENMESELQQIKSKLGIIPTNENSKHGK